MNKLENNPIIPHLCPQKQLMNTFLFTADMKLADILHSNYRLLLLLPRFGLNLGFGEKSVAEYCRETEVSEQLFIMICNIYTFEHYLPGSEELAQLDIQSLVNYLQLSHSYYLDNRIRMLGEQLHDIAGQCIPTYRKILNRFFEEYKNEVINHFEYEEKTVFPYILHILEGKNYSGYEIEIFEQNHSNIEDKLNDLKNIIIKYLPGTSSLTEKTGMLFNIFSLEEDLSKHTLIEDRLLIPLVQKLEQHYGK